MFNVGLMSDDTYRTIDGIVVCLVAYLTTCLYTRQIKILWSLVFIYVLFVMWQCKVNY